jgi:hypothetical protein
VKKLLIFAVCLLALGFAANSFAIQAEIPADTTAAIAKGGTQITIGGDLRVRGVIQSNTGDFNSNSTSDSGTHGKNERMFYDYRYRLNVEAKVTPNTIGFIQFDVAEGDSAGTNGVMGTSADGTKDGRGSIKYGEAKTNDVRLTQAWIQHSGSGLFGIPAYFKFGHQPITIGAGVFYSHTYNNDDAFVAGISPIKGLDLTIATVKLNENTESAADDADAYSFMATYAFSKALKAGLDVSLVDLQNGSAPTTVAVFGAGAHTKAQLWNIGLNVKGDVQGFKLYGTADFQLGQLKLQGADNYDFRGFAITAGASYKFAPVKVALDLGYGSGDSNGADKKISTFMTAQSNVVHYTFVYDYMTKNAGGNTCGGLQNTLFAKLGASGDVMKGLNIGGSLTLLEAAKRAYGDGVNSASPISSSTNTPSSRYIGTELDATLTYQIDKGLKYFVEAGYLFAGKYWRVPVNGSTTTHVDDPWAVRHGIQLTF